MAADGIRFFGAEHGCHRAGGPEHAVVRRFVARAGAHAKQTAFAFDHHLSCVVMGCADQAHAAVTAARDEARDPFRARARLAAAATAEEQPDAPIARWGKLCIAGPETPVAAEEFGFIVT